MPLDPYLKLRKGLPSDVPTMVDIFLDAFSGNTVGRTFFPRHAPSTQHFWTRTLTEEIHDPNAHFLIVSDASARPVAFAKWVAPLPRGTLVPPMPAESEWPVDGDPKLAAVFFQKLANMHDDIMVDRPHWYLEIMVTRGADQGRGAGGLMMAWGVKKADEDGVEAYLDATPEGKPLYEKFGFQNVVTWPFFDDTYRHSFMLRNPMEPGGKRGSAV